MRIESNSTWGSKLQLEVIAAVWLASDDSDNMHGAGIFVDGGMTPDSGFETGE